MSPYRNAPVPAAIGTLVYPLARTAAVVFGLAVPVILAIGIFGEPGDPDHPLSAYVTCGLLTVLVLAMAITSWRTELRLTMQAELLVIRVRSWPWSEETLVYPRHRIHGVGHQMSEDPDARGRGRLTLVLEQGVAVPIQTDYPFTAAQLARSESQLRALLALDAAGR